MSIQITGESSVERVGAAQAMSSGPGHASGLESWRHSNSHAAASYQRGYRHRPNCAGEKLVKRCAIHLAKDHGIKATVLEANRVAWGCNTRNGGQAQIAAGRLKRSEWIGRWGVEIAKNFTRKSRKVWKSSAISFAAKRSAARAGRRPSLHRAKLMPGLKMESQILNKPSAIARASSHAKKCTPTMSVMPKPRARFGSRRAGNVPSIVQEFGNTKALDLRFLRPIPKRKRMHRS
jgi:hypothetical protein